jgi:hypothetical protein
MEGKDGESFFHPWMERASEIIIKWMDLKKNHKSS